MTVGEFRELRLAPSASTRAPQSARTATLAQLQQTRAQVAQALFGLAPQQQVLLGADQLTTLSRPALPATAASLVWNALPAPDQARVAAALAPPEAIYRAFYQEMQLPTPAEAFSETQWALLADKPLLLAAVRQDSQEGWAPWVRMVDYVTSDDYPLGDHGDNQDRQMRIIRSVLLEAGDRNSICISHRMSNAAHRLQISTSTLKRLMQTHFERTLKHSSQP